MTVANFACVYIFDIQLRGTTMIYICQLQLQLHLHTAERYTSMLFGVAYVVSSHVQPRRIRLHIKRMCLGWMGQRADRIASDMCRTQQCGEVLVGATYSDPSSRAKLEEHSRRCPR